MYPFPAQFQVRDIFLGKLSTPLARIGGSVQSGVDGFLPVPSDGKSATPILVFGTVVFSVSTCGTRRIRRKSAWQKKGVRGFRYAQEMQTA